MKLHVKGRNFSVTDDFRDLCARRFEKVQRQVSEESELEIELIHERNPSIADNQVAEATLYLKGVTLRASDASPDMQHSIILISNEIARQVKRHRDKRRKRREARRAATDTNMMPGAMALPATEQPGAGSGAF